MYTPTNPVATHTDLLCSLPRRTPGEVCGLLTHLARTTGGGMQDDRERFWHLNWCGGLSITGWKTPDDAAWVANYVRGTVRGPACRQWHAVLDVARLTYVGPSLWQAFCDALPSTLNPLGNSPWVVRVPTDRFRHVLVPGLPDDEQPWLVFRAKPDAWFVGWGTGDYPHERRLRQVIDASGIHAMIAWLFYEVHSQPQWSHHEMKLWSHEIWERCPRPIAIRLVPALHTFFTDLVLQIDREQRGVPALTWETA